MKVEIGVGAGVTVVVTLAVLLAVFVSGVEAETTAVLVIVVLPGAVTATWMVTEAKPGEGMSPRLATTVPPFRPQLPWLELHERNEVPPGSGSFTTTFCEVLGPLLLTLSV